MENILDDSLLELQIDDLASETLEKTSKWARFIAIVFICFVSIFFIAVIIYLTLYKDVLGTLFQTNIGSGYLLGLVWAVVIIFLFAAVFYSILLLNFSINVLRGVREKSQPSLEKGISNFKVLIIVSVVFAILTTLYEISNFLKIVR